MDRLGLITNWFREPWGNGLVELYILLGSVGDRVYSKLFSNTNPRDT